MITAVAHNGVQGGRTVSTTINIPPGSDRALLVAVTWNNDNFETLSPLANMTRIGAAETLDDGRIEFWWRPNPPLGTNTVTATVSALLAKPTQVLAIGAWALAGVSGVRGVSFGYATPQVDRSTMSTTVATEPGDVVLVTAISEDGALYGASLDAPVNTDWAVGSTDRALGGHVIATGASVTATLTIGGEDNLIIGAVAVEPVAPPAGPVVDFTADPLFGEAPLTVYFDSTVTGNGVTGYVWDFGSGPVNDEGHPALTKTYTEPGLYTVSLTVTDADGSITATKPDLVSVTPPADADPPPVTAELPPSGPVPVDRETQIRANAPEGDEADDPAIYYDPTDPAASVVIGAFKHDGGGLAVYNLQGQETDYLQLGQCNNVDLRVGVMGGRALLVTTERTTNTLRYVWLDHHTKTLSLAGGTPLLLEPYGCCLYVSPVDGAVHAFVTERHPPHRVEQYRLSVDGSTVTGEKVREFTTATLSEGMVCDDEVGYLFLGEEDIGVFRYNAEPGGGSARVTVDVVGPGGHLTDDVEGLAIARSAGPSYLIASSQGDSTFQVYDLAPPHAWRKEFWLTAGPGGQPDAVSDTDGIEVMWRNLGPDYPHGLFVAHDNDNEGAHVSNFKYASLGPILGAIAEPGPWQVWDGSRAIPVDLLGVLDGTSIMPGTLTPLL